MSSDKSLILLAQGYWLTLDEQLSKLTIAEVAQQEETYLAYAWLHKHENNIWHQLPQTTTLKWLHAIVTTDFATIAAHKTNINKVSITENPLAYIIGQIALANFEQAQGNRQQAENIYSALSQHPHLGQWRALALLLIAEQSSAHIWAGHLSYALVTYRQLISFNEQHQHPIMGVGQVGSAYIHILRNELQIANDLLNAATQAVERGGLQHLRFYILLQKANLAMYAQEYPTAHEWLATLHHELIPIGEAQNRRPILLAMHAKSAFLAGELEVAWYWLEQIDISNYLATGYDAIVPAIYALVAFYSGEHTLGTQLITTLIQDDRSQRRISHLIWHLAIYATGLALQHKTDEALQQLTSALGYAKHERYIRGFLNCGSAMFSLLQEANARGIEPIQTRTLLKAFDVNNKIDNPLTPREHEILCLVQQGKSNRVIATELVLALSTVKRHIMNIYQKLDVHNRTQAILRGQELGIL